MSTQDLLNMLKTIPYGILTYGNTDYEFQVIERLNRIDINFILGIKIIGYIKVLGNYTMRLIWYEDLKKKPEYVDYFTAANNTMTYLEILGFKKC